MEHLGGVLKVATIISRSNEFRIDTAGDGTFISTRLVLKPFPWNTCYFSLLRKLLNEFEFDALFHFRITF